jgi:hypothetical protein
MSLAKAPTPCAHRMAATSLVTTSPAGTHDGYCGGHSPDGRQLLFLRADLPDEEQATLMVVNVDGSDERPLIAQKVGLWCDWSPTAGPS